MRHPTKSAFLAVIVTAALWLNPVFAGKINPEDEGRIALAVANWLQQAHYSREKLDDAMSAKLLATYLELLDYNKLYLTQEDVDEFTEKYGTHLDDMILRGDLSAAREIFDRFLARVESRVLSFLPHS